MKIIVDYIRIEELKQMAAEGFGNLVKAVVDVETQQLAVDAELHSDLQALLLEHGSRLKNTWGINVYPEMSFENFVGFDSLINVKPSQGNLSRGIDNTAVREKISRIIKAKVQR
jgi:hypothetical protein